MKRRTRSLDLQLNLSLVSAPALTVSPDKQQELKRALIELLTSATGLYRDTRDQPGDDDESQTHQ